MCVTDIIRDIITYSEGNWQEPKKPDAAKELERYNRGMGRFLFYPWGVWITAYARRNLFTGIIEFAGDYLYADTDSAKVVNIDRHMDYINRYNAMVREKLKLSMQHHKLPFEMVEPETIQGKKKLLGVWDFDGKYSRFKSLGAKRYMVEYADSGEINITVSGLNKQVCVPFLCTGWNYDLKTHTEHNSPFDRFNDEMRVPPKYTGKLTHTYIDDEQRGVLIDYMGNPGTYYEKSSVHLESAGYDLSLATEYVQYIEGLREIRI